MANLGTIEINPWNSRLDSLDNPDYLAIDLDPNGRSFDEVIEVALAFHELLDELEAPGWAKTSGKSGLHIFVPLAAQYTYEQVRQFALLLNHWIQGQFPKITSLERNPRKRQKLIYLDYLQNRWGQTLAAPYSLRPRPGAPASTPLHWSEVQPGLDPRDFNIHTLPGRVKEQGDLWQGVLGPGIDMQRCLERLEKRWNQTLPAGSLKA
jgi:bifunctional non-homologous end joining protein LigD